MRGLWREGMRVAERRDARMNDLKDCPLYSIIIPVFNTAPYQPACLKSLTDQDVDEWEAICVDDGSTDGSPAILDDFAARDSRFRVVHQANAGEGAARNAALKLARGRWIAFLDADDFLSSQAFALWNRALTSFPDSEVIFFGTQFFPVTAEAAFPTPDGGSVADVSCVDVSEKMPNVSLARGFASRIYRRDILADLTFADYKVGADVDFMVSAMLRAHHGALVGTVLYGYRQFDRRPVRPVPLSRICDRLAFSSSILNKFLHSKRVIDEGNFRRYYKNVMKGALREMFEVAPADRDEAWSVWWRTVDRILTFPGLPVRHRIRLLIASKIHNRVLARLLFVK